MAGTPVAENKAAKTDEKVADNKPDDKVAKADTGAGGDVAAKKVLPEPPANPDDQGIAAPQGRRVALVIGIGAYKAVPELPNQAARCRRCCQRDVEEDRRACRRPDHRVERPVLVEVAERDAVAACEAENAVVSMPEKPFRSDWSK